MTTLALLTISNTILFILVLSMGYNKVNHYIKEKKRQRETKRKQELRREIKREVNAYLQKLKTT